MASRNCAVQFLPTPRHDRRIDASAGAVSAIARLVAHSRSRWPQVRLILRAASGFARDGLTSWCEANKVGYGLGLARNARLVGATASEPALATAEAEQSGEAARCFEDCRYQTLDSRSPARRVVCKAEQLVGGDAEPSGCARSPGGMSAAPTGANPRFVVTSLAAAWAPRPLHEELHGTRGEMANRIKQCRLDRFADRISAGTMRANQLRLWFASLA